MKKSGLIGLFIRIAIFGVVLAAYLITGNIAEKIFDTPFLGRFTSIHLIWAILMAGMLLQFIPTRKTGVSNGKQFGQLYMPPQQGYDPKRLMQESRKMNEGARKVLIFWLVINAALAALYFIGVLSSNAVLLVVMVYYLCDAFCMVIWCPLQKAFTKSRCCVDCRIYGWGYFLVFGPLLLLPPDFFTISLALLSLALLIRWETAYALHPERFWSGSNISLRCNNCTSRDCELKRHIVRAINPKTID